MESLAGSSASKTLNPYNCSMEVTALLPQIFGSATVTMVFLEISASSSGNARFAEAAVSLVKSSSKEKTVPRPGSLSTSMLPPMNSTSLLEMLRPSPVPPYFLVIELSACENAANILPILCVFNPIPVSKTRNLSLTSVSHSA